jgi:sporulation protein YlmC with PRC-barrel domain
MGRKSNLLLVMIGCLVFLPGLAWAKEQAETALYATKIIDKNIYNNKGQAIGEIDDLVIRRNGKIKKVTVDVGGFLDIGEKLISYPFSKLRFENNRITVDATQEQLEKRQPFDYYKQGLSQDYYYGLYPPYAAPAYGPYYGRFYGPPWGVTIPYEGMQRRKYMQGVWTFSPGRYLASVVLGREMIDPTGQRLGEIKNLVINGNGQVEKIILEADVLGDNIYVALPYEELGFTYYGIVYDITVDELKKLSKVEYKD